MSKVSVPLRTAILLTLLFGAAASARAGSSSSLPSQPLYPSQTIATTPAVKTVQNAAAASTSDNNDQSRIPSLDLTFAKPLLPAQQVPNAPVSAALTPRETAPPPVTLNVGLAATNYRVIATPQFIHNTPEPGAIPLMAFGLPLVGSRCLRRRSQRTANTPSRKVSEE